MTVIRKIHEENIVFWTWYSNHKKINILLIYCKEDMFQVSGFIINYDSDTCFLCFSSEMHYCTMSYLFVLDLRKSRSEGSLMKKVDFSLWKSWQSKHFVFSSLWWCWWGTEFKHRQKAGSDNALCSMWKIKVSDKEKSMHSLYTSQHPRTFFLSLSLCFLFFFSMKVFHTEDTHLWSGREPTDTKMAKVHLINSWQARACSLWHRKWSD